MDRQKSFEAAYQRHFKDTFGDAAGDYDAYAPAYRFGRQQATDARFLGRSYEAVAPDLRALFELRYPRESFRAFEKAVRFGFEAAREAWYPSKVDRLQQSDRPLAALDDIQIDAGGGGARRAEAVAAGMSVGDPPQPEHRTYEATDVYEEREAAFRTHYRETFASSGQDYAVFAPAYQLGMELAQGGQYQGFSYEQVEPDVRRLYLGHYPDRRYDQVKQAVAFAYSRMRDAKGTDAPDVA